jgi:hypothetical protein
MPMPAALVAARAQTRSANTPVRTLAATLLSLLASRGHCHHGRMKTQCRDCGTGKSTQPCFVSFTHQAADLLSCRFFVGHCCCNYEHGRRNSWCKGRCASKGRMRKFELACLSSALFAPPKIINKVRHPIEAKTQTRPINRPTGVPVRL